MTHSHIKKNVLSITSDLHTLKPSFIKENPQLLCVTKYASIEQINTLIKLGLTYFGENKVQDTKKK